MTDCPNDLMRDLLPDYALGALDADASARVRAHLADCAACRGELGVLSQVRAGLAMGTPRVDVAAIVSALPVPPGRGATVVPLAPRLRVSRHVWQYAAAAGLVLVAGGGLFLQRTPAPDRVVVADTARVGIPAESAATVTAVATDGISFGGGLSDLSVDDLQALLRQMDSVRTLPSADPESVTPVIAMNEGGKTL